jgi:hypothetical protein
MIISDTVSEQLNSVVCYGKITSGRVMYFCAGTVGKRSRALSQLGAALFVARCYSSSDVVSGELSLLSAALIETIGVERQDGAERLH